LGLIAHHWAGHGSRQRLAVIPAEKAVASMRYSTSTTAEYDHLIRRVWVVGRET
jgi:hypothetical protein